MKLRSVVTAVLLATTGAVPTAGPPEAAREVVEPRALDGYIANPGMGWQEARTLAEPVLPETVAYRRSSYGWALFNPAPGVYDFSRLDEDLAEAQAAGKQLAFRLYTMRGEQYGGHQLPSWLLTEGARLLPSGEPDYSSCAYQGHWARMVDELRRRYDGNPTIAWVDISGYGNFNEWSWQSQTEWDSDHMRPTSLDGQARRRLADMFIGGSGTAACRGPEGETRREAYNYRGWEHTQLIMPAAGVQQSSRYVAARDQEVGIRHDCLGSPDHQDGVLSRIGDLLDSVWHRAPVVYELCAGSTGDQEYVAAAEDLLARTHATAIHGNLVGPRDVTVLRDLLSQVGYRYVLTRAEFPSRLSPGSRARVQLIWANTGSAPSYPRMGQVFEVRMGLRDRSGIVVAESVVPADVEGWMPRSGPGDEAPVNEVRTTFTIPELPPGMYTVTVAVVDSRTGRPISLAISGRADDGRYDLAEVEVGADEVGGHEVGGR